MTGRGRRLPVGDGWAGPARAALRGLLVFLAVAGIGLAIGLTAVPLAVPGVSPAGALRIALLYLGAFHHVPLVVEGQLAAVASTPSGAGVPGEVTLTLELGVALLSVTALAVWLLFRAGRTSATAGGPGARAATGAAVALGYAPPLLLVALAVRFDEPVRLGSFVTGDVRVSMGTWQALVFPAALAAAAGAAGGVWGWTSAHRERSRAIRSRAVLGGGWRMLLFALGLSLAGLFVAGVLQPDEPVALATPSTARYVSTVFDAPGRGAAIASHHAALLPNEAWWTLVPASGACDVVRGSEDHDLLCYERFPTGITWGAEVTFANAPAGYLAFLLVPALATLLGGRWAGRAVGAATADAVAAGAASGIVFAALVLAGCLLASITVSYAIVRGGASDVVSLWIGPDPVGGTVSALAWGVAGGSLGGAVGGLRRPRAAARAGAPPAAR